MPELPDVTAYIESLEARIKGARLEKVTLLTPFLLRTAVPPIAASEGKMVSSLGRIGKRILLHLEEDLLLVLHLMIAGRLHWESKNNGKRSGNTLAQFDFDSG